MSGLWTPYQQEVAGIEANGGLSIGVSGQSPGLIVPEILVIADERIRVDILGRVALVDDMPLEDLSPKEFDVLATLAQHPDELVTHDELSYEVWGDPDFHLRSRSPTTIMKNLRGQLGQELGDVAHGAIRTRPGRGYSAVSSLGKLTRPDSLGNSDEIYRIADDRIEIDRVNQLIVADGIVLDFTPQQFKFLAHMAIEPGRVYTPLELAKAMWEDVGNFNFTRGQSVRTGIAQVRKKLGPELGNSTKGAVRNRHNVGYCTVKTLGT